MRSFSGPGYALLRTYRSVHEKRFYESGLPSGVPSKASLVSGIEIDGAVRDKVCESGQVVIDGAAYEFALLCYPEFRWVVG
jgi:hypothetical protein